jgi:signal transduction histidine kinase
VSALPLGTTWGDVATAVGCALWSAAFLVGTGAAAWVVPPLTAAALLVLAHRPTTGGVLVALAELAVVPFDVPSENPAGLPALLAAVYLVGRRVPVWPGAVGPAAMLAALLLVDEVSVADLLFGVLLIGGTWTFGVLVRQRSVAARAAGEVRAELAAEDVAARARTVVAEERGRIAAEALVVIEEAVRAMKARAEVAAAGLDPRLLDEIRESGSEAVADLRRLLGLLRDAGQADLDAGPPAGDGRVRRALVVDGLTAVAAALLLVVDVVGTPPGSVPLSFANGLVLSATLVLRRLACAPAVLLACAPVAVAATGAPVTTGPSFLLCTVLLAWSVGASPDRRAWEAMALLGFLVLVGTVREEPGNVPMQCALLGVPWFAGAAWHQRDRELARARREAAVMRSEHDAVVATAVRAERLRLARDLHDVASHAVGVMVLHAGAAAAQRIHDPAAARQSLSVVQGAAERALVELGRLGGVLATPARDALPPDVALRELVGRLSEAGLRITLDLRALPAEPDTATVVHRVVHEALTNVARHAPGARVVVRVDGSGDHVVVEVTDDGAVSAPGTPGSGFGLVGLAERVRARGGHLVTGPAPHGGFSVRAVLPARLPSDPALS